jgi:hypothetical protein
MLDNVFAVDHRWDTVLALRCMVYEGEWSQESAQMQLDQH